jgi:hypothetical protein
MEMSGQIYAPAALPPGKESPLPIREEAERAPDPVYGKENMCLNYHESKLESSAVQPVAIPTELFRLQFVVLHKSILEPG